MIRTKFEPGEWVYCHQFVRGLCAPDFDTKNFGGFRAKVVRMKGMRVELTTAGGHTGTAHAAACEPWDEAAKRTTQGETVGITRGQMKSGPGNAQNVRKSRIPESVAGLGDTIKRIIER